MIETVAKSLKRSNGNDFCSVGLMTTLGIDQNDVVAVGRRMRDIIEADDAAGARLVIGDDRLPKRVAELLRQNPPGEIDDTARLEGQDQVNGPRRKGLGARRRNERQQQCGPQQHARRG